MLTAMGPLPTAIGFPALPVVRETGITVPGASGLGRPAVHRRHRVACRSSGTRRGGQMVISASGGQRVNGRDAGQHRLDGRLAQHRIDGEAGHRRPGVTGHQRAAVERVAAPVAHPAQPARANRDLQRVPLKIPETEVAPLRHKIR